MGEINRLTAWGALDGLCMGTSVAGARDLHKTVSDFMVQLESQLAESEERRLGTEEWRRKYKDQLADRDREIERLKNFQFRQSPLPMMARNEYEMERAELTRLSGLLCMQDTEVTRLRKDAERLVMVRAIMQHSPGLWSDASRLRSLAENLSVPDPSTPRRRATHGAARGEGEGETDA